MRVLIVEDNPGDRVVVAEALSDAGMSCLFAESLADARRVVEAMRPTKPDLILCDLFLPDSPGGGLEPVARFVEDGFRVAVMTGLGQDRGLAEKAAEAGAVDFVVKGGEDLYGAIAALAERVKRGTGEAEFERLFRRTDWRLRCASADAEHRVTEAEREMGRGKRRDRGAEA